MGAAGGPNIATDGLVFGYDTGNSLRSYKGRPTKNQFPVVGTIGEGPDADNFVTFPTKGTNGVERLGYGQTFGGYTIKPSDAVYRYNNVTTLECAYFGGTATIPVGAYVTFTFEYLVSEGITIDTGFLSNLENYGNNAFSTNPGTIGNSIERNVWHKIKYTAGPKTTNAGTQAMFLYPGGCSSTRFSSTDGYLLYKNPMVEFNTDTIDSQYTQTERSVTGSLLDLTGNSELDLTNLDGFNADAEIDFDGTNDRIEIDNNSYVDVTGAELTLEQVIKKDTSSAFTTVHKDVQYSLRISGDNIQYADSSNWSYSSFGSHAMGVSNGEYFHLVAVKKDGVVTIYVNNSVVVSKSFGSSITSTSNNLFIGAYSGTSNFMNGQIPITKIYNKALTVEEVERNFQGVRKRFGI